MEKLDPKRPSLPADTAKTQLDQDLDEVQKLYEEHWADPDFQAEDPDKPFQSERFNSLELCFESFYRHEGFKHHIKRLEDRELLLLRMMANLKSQEDYRMLQARAWAMRQLILEFKNKSSSNNKAFREKQ